MRRTFRWRSADQYSPLASFADAGVWASADPCGAGFTAAFHSTARLRVSATTSSLDNFVTLSIVAVGLASPAALAVAAAAEDAAADTSASASAASAASAGSAGFP